MAKCVHHWLLGKPVTRYTRKSQSGIRMRGDLIETTHMVCRLCGRKKKNVVVLPPDWDY